MKRPSRATFEGARAARPPFWLLITLTLLSPTQLRAQAEEDAELSGSWVVRRAGDDELAFRLEIEGDVARIELIRQLTHWPVVPDASLLTPGDAVVVTATAEATTSVRLARGDWWARLELQSPGTAIFIAANQSRIGIAHRLTPLVDELLGDWERAEMSPAGPRVRRVTVEDDRVVFYDPLDRSETVLASGVQTSEPAVAVALFPDNRSGALIRLIPFDGGYLALEVGDDEIQVIYPVGEPPRWLPLEPYEGTPNVAASHSLTGRWLVGSGDRVRQTGILDFTTSTASLSRLGRNRSDPVNVLTDSAPPYFRVAIGSDSEVEYRHVLVVNEDSGVMWGDDDNNYQTIRRVIEAPEALAGEWRVENVGAWVEETMSLANSGLYRPRSSDVVPVLFSSRDQDAMEVTWAHDGSVGRMVRLWSFGDGGYVTDSGALWYRPGRRVEIAERFFSESCPDLSARVAAHLAHCLPESCDEAPGTEAVCPLAAAIIEPLRCTEDHRREADRLLAVTCQDVWNRAFGDETP